MTQTIEGIVNLLERTTSARTLIISSRTTPMQVICSIVPIRIKHLQVPINNTEDMKVILNRFEHLFSVTFSFATVSSISHTEVFDWLTSLGRDFTNQLTICSLSLWLGKKTRG